MTVVAIEDPYIWMEDLNNPKVIEWALNEDRKTREMLSTLAKKIESRIAEYFLMPRITVVTVTRKGYFILVREKDCYKVELLTRDGEIIELVNSKEVGDEIVFQTIQASEEGNRLAYYYSHGGLDEGVVRIVDVDSLELLDELKGSIYNIVWIDDNRYYYVRFFRTKPAPDGVQPPTSRIYLREDGKDIMVFGEGVPTSHFIGIIPSTDNSKALITVSYGWKKSTVYGGKLEYPETWRRLYGGDFIVHPVDYVNGEYLLTTYEKNGLGRIIALSEPDSKSRIVIDEQPHILQEAVIVKGKILAHYLVDASSVLKTFTLKGNLLHGIKFNAPGTVRSLDSNGHEAVFFYESFLVPYKVYRFDGSLKIMDYREITGDFSIEEEWTTSKDGTKIHMFVVKKRNVDPKNVLIYGYGGFRHAITPSFRSYIIPYILDGGTFVIANIRGGIEYGERWHREGMREKKQNVFDDFKAAIKFFKDRGARVIAMGQSNGGLLVGAVLTQNPEILDGAVIGYPVLDMLRFHKLYIGKAWVPEYGNPEDPREASYLAKYSPYHNIRETKYPPTLVYTGLNDDRVHPAHAFKFVAKLKDVNAPVFLRVENESGHSGASPRTKIKEYADIMAFIYKIFEMEP